MTVLDENLNLDRQAPISFLGPHGRLRFFNNKRKLRIASYYWPAHTNCARGILYICHGKSASNMAAKTVNKQNTTVVELLLLRYDEQYLKRNELLQAMARILRTISSSSESLAC